MTNLECQDDRQSAFPIHKQTSLFQGNLRKVKTLVKSLFLRPQRTLDLEYQDGGDELQDLITEITAMRDPGLLISVVQGICLLAHLLPGGCISALWPSLTTKTSILYTLCGNFCTESRLACTYFQKSPFAYIKQSIANTLGLSITCKIAIMPV